MGLCQAQQLLGSSGHRSKGRVLPEEAAGPETSLPSERPSGCGPPNHTPTRVPPGKGLPASDLNFGCCLLLKSSKIFSPFTRSTLVVMAATSPGWSLATVWSQGPGTEGRVRAHPEACPHCPGHRASALTFRQEQFESHQVVWVGHSGGGRAPLLWVLRCGFITQDQGGEHSAGGVGGDLGEGRPGQGNVRRGRQGQEQIPPSAGIME